MLAGVVATTAAWPVTTRYGVDYHWSTRRVTLFEKTVNFISRDLQMRHVASEVTGDRPLDETGLVELFEWVRAHVRPTPQGFHVYDDHVLNILIRGYGAPDQQAEALAILASYRGLPATAVKLAVEDIHDPVLLTVIRTDRKRVLFDVRNGVVFRRRDGSLADVDDLARDSGLVARAAPGLTIRGVPYERYFATFSRVVPSFARMELQKPWPRLKAEMRKLLAR